MALHPRTNQHRLECCGEQSVTTLVKDAHLALVDDRPVVHRQQAYRCIAAKQRLPAQTSASEAGMQADSRT
jgi:hypothetical protein